MSTSAITTPVTQPLSFWLNVIFVPIYEDKETGYLSALGILRRMKRPSRVLYHQKRFIRQLETVKADFESTRSDLAEQYDVAGLLHQRMHGENWDPAEATAKAEAWKAFDAEVAEAMNEPITLDFPLIAADEIDRNGEYWNDVVFTAFDPLLNMDSFDTGPVPGGM